MTIEIYNTFAKLCYCYEPFIVVFASTVFLFSGKRKTKSLNTLYYLFPLIDYDMVFNFLENKKQHLQIEPIFPFLLFFVSSFSTLGSFMEERTKRCRVWKQNKTGWKEENCFPEYIYFKETSLFSLFIVWK